MNYCCDQFDWLVSDAGKAGLSFIIRKVGDTNGVFLQSRVCDIQHESKLRNLPVNGDLPNPFRISAQQGIRHCPFCGKNIKDFLESIDQGILDEIVYKHKSFEMK